jgi:hypothetical protein
LTRAGVGHTLTEPEIACNISDKVAKLAIRNFINRDHQDTEGPDVD